MFQLVIPFNIGVLIKIIGKQMTNIEIIKLIIELKTSNPNDYMEKVKEKLSTTNKRVVIKKTDYGSVTEIEDVVN